MMATCVHRWHLKVVYLFLMLNTLYFNGELVTCFSFILSPKTTRWALQSLSTLKKVWFGFLVD